MKKQPKSIDLTIFQKTIRDELASHLEYLKGSKDLFFDEELMKPFDLISGAAFLKQNGVQKIYKLQPTIQEATSNQVIFIVRPYPDRMKLIAKIINLDREKGVEKRYHIVLTPKRLNTCDLLLEQEGIYGDVTIAEFNSDFFQLDDDVLSLEMPLCFKQFYAEKDTTWYSSVARTLIMLQEAFGTLADTFCFGTSAKAIYELMQIMSEGRNFNLPNGNEIGSVIVLDRDVDYASLLCSQLTYEGLVAERFGIKSSVGDFPKEVTKTEQGIKLRLNSSDRVFFEIRGLHISSIFQVLSHKAKMIQCGYDKRNDLDSVSEMKQFVSEDLKRLRKDHSSLAVHIGAGEAIMSKWKSDNFEECMHIEQCLLYDVDFKDSSSYVETCINRQADSLHCLRLLCLLSVAKGGLDPKLYKSLKLQYLQSFGYKHLLTFKSLKDSGLYTENTDRRNIFPRVKKKFNLIPKSPDTVNLGISPSDVSYVFGGAYTPFVTKLVEQICAKGLTTTLEESLTSSGVSTFKYKQGSSARANKSTASSNTILIVFLGGCTHTEINALRFIGVQLGVRFVILTTAVVTAKEVLETLSVSK